MKPNKFHLTGLDRGELKEGEEMEITVSKDGEIFSSDNRTFEMIHKMFDETNVLFGSHGLCG